MLGVSPARGVLPAPTRGWKCAWGRMRPGCFVGIFFGPGAFGEASVVASWGSGDVFADESPGFGPATIPPPPALG